MKFLLLPLLGICFMGCNRTPPQVMGSPMFSDDYTMASLLRRNWTLCQKSPRGSIQTELGIGGGQIDVKSHVFETEDCSGTDFESYNLALFSHEEFESDPRAGGKTGEASVNLLHYYPNDELAGENLVRFGSEVLLSASIRLTLSDDAQSLKVEFLQGQAIALRDLVRNHRRLEPLAALEKNSIPGFLLQMVAQKALPVTMGGLTDQLFGLPEDKVWFESELAALDWNFKTVGPLVHSECVHRYFTGMNSQAIPKNVSFVKGLFENALPHQVLFNQGFQAKSASVFFFESTNLTPYLGIYMDYQGAQNAERSSGYFCPIVKRAKGLVVHRDVE